jgi:hypothetical protein
VPTGGDLWWTRVDWGCERGRALFPGCCGVVVEDPCGGLHGVFERRRVVGCVKCRFFCCILGSPCRSPSSLFRSAQAERLMVSVRKRTWSSQRAMPDRGPCTLHISLSGWFFVLGSCMKRSMGCRVIASKWATASHGIHTHRRPAEQHDLGRGWVLGSGCGGDGSK